MEQWLHQVAEVVVVDSHSDDGTLQLIQEKIHHPHLRIYQQPRGLYQAWNFGISKITAKYTYISTVGDTITPDGLDHLADIAEKHGCDVVVSKPDFMKADGSPSDQIRWPIDDVIENLKIIEPIILSDLQLLLFQIKNLPETVLGSSASNLYRTDLMKRCPLPTEYGTAGDAAWGFKYGMNNRIGITPGKFSTFLQHEKSYPRKSYAVDQLNEKLIDALEGSFLSKMSSSESCWNLKLQGQIKELFSLLREAFLHQAVLEKSREGTIPWVLNPIAWKSRAKRARLRHVIQKNISENLIN